MIIFILMLLLVSNLSNSMQMQEINGEPKEFPRTLIMRDQIELDEHVDARYANKYMISFYVDKDDAKKTCIAAAWKHWFDGWRRTVCKNSLPKLNNDQLQKIRSVGLCALKYPYVLCALAATMSRESGEKYDVCWLVRYNLVERASALFFPMTCGKIQRLKFKESTDKKKFKVTAYSRQNDQITKTSQIISDSFKQVVPTSVVAVWKKAPQS